MKRGENVVGQANGNGVVLVSQNGTRLTDTCVYRCPCGAEFVSTRAQFKRIRGCEACRAATQDAKIKRVRALANQIGDGVPRDKRCQRYVESLGIFSYHLRRMVAARSILLGIDPPVVDADYVRAIEARIGEKPRGGEFAYSLDFIDGSCAPTPENYCYKRFINKQQKESILKASPSLHAHSAIMQARDLSDERLKEAIKNGVRRKRCKNRVYDKNVGRVFGDFVVQSVSYRERPDTQVICAIYDLKCRRCGARKTAYAHFLHSGKLTHCNKCGVCFTWTRNSAWSLLNKYGRFSVKFRDIANPGLSTRLLMMNYMSEFTIFHGQPSYMEARIDADLLGKEV